MGYDGSMIRVVLVVLLSAAMPARADIADDPNTESAKRHFSEAMKFYEASDYSAALRELEAGRAAKPLAAFDFNIGRCLDRLERLPEAIEAYQRYVDSQPTPEDAPTVRARIDQIRERLARLPVPAVTPVEKPVEPPPPPKKPVSKRAVVLGVVAGVVVVVGVGLGVGLGLGLSSTQPPSASFGQWMLHP
jgi:tetratricopeptide (TPR) repeat protein